MGSQINKPLLVYDGACDFCRYWIARWQHVTQDRIDYASYQQVTAEFPEIPISVFQTSVKLILENGQIFSGAEAVLRALDNRFLLWSYNNLPGFALLSEAVYQFVAKHRPFFSKVTRWFWKTHSE